tara:strand:+ start:347 stop:1402 length:1056 start_codon:yes stop_codon:yes gene_type:complete
MLYPVLSSLRYKTQRSNFNLGKINLRYIKKYNFYYNSSFNNNKIKYNKNYNNDQSVSVVFKNHLFDVLKILDKKFDQNTRICEVGCGKGFFLNLLEKKYKNVIGYDTSYEGKKKNIHKRYLTVNDRIDSDLIILRQTLEHIPNYFNFLKMLKKISISDPYILIEVPDLDWIIKKQAFWDITYEHVNYFSKKTFQKLFSGTFKIKKLFKGQYLLVLTKLSNLNLNFDKNLKFNSVSIYKIFPNIENKISNIEKINNGNLFFWGGSTKTLMFLCHCNQKNKLLNKIKYIVDMDINKQNQYLQVVNKKIISPTILCKYIKKNDTVVVSNTNYLKEVKTYLQKNLKFKVKCLGLD